MNRRTLPAAALTACLLFQIACSGGWSTLLRTALVASPAFITSLNLGAKREAVVNDFVELGSDAADFADDLKACNKDKPCSLAAVNKLQTKFWDVLRHGNFKLHPKLAHIQELVQGIIDSARIFFGSRQAVARGTSPRSVTEADLKAQIEELKTALK